MKFDTILVRYGEIGLKSEQTRHLFERKLLQNIENVLKFFSVKYEEITREWGRVYVKTTDESAFQCLKMVFGVVSFSPASSCSSDMNEISKLSLEVAAENIRKQDTFAVRASRQGAHSFSSRDIGIRVGADIQKATHAGVNLDKPTREVFVEVRNKKAFVFTEKFHGPGGIPQGIEGTAVGIFRKSEPFQAAAYLMAKRGCNIEAVTVEDLDVDRLQYWLGNLKVHKLGKGADLYEEAETLAKNIGAKAIFTADALPKDNLAEIENYKKVAEKLTLPVFRPLIGWNEKIIKKLDLLE